MTDAIEEVFAGQLTGIEAELEDFSPTEPKPWDPEKIRVTTKSFSLRNVLDMIDSDDLELAPDFQRNRVWKYGQKSRLIESVMLQIPLPAFYFAEDGDGMLRVVDGLQRLSTIHDFARSDSFELRDLEYLKDREGLNFHGIGPILQRRIHNTQIVAHVIDPTTPDDVKYDIFKRINTGGEPLNAMEIRHCMSKPRSRNFLKDCTMIESFHRATNGTLRDHVRMNDREAALRFVAFRLLDDTSQYDEFGSLERLLDWACRVLDDEKQVSDDDLHTLRVEFDRAMRSAFKVFGVHAFRKWPVDSERMFPINRALFESWAFAFAEADVDPDDNARERISSTAREAMSFDERYISSISTSTSDPARVAYRFNTARQIVGQR
ncbi:DUF262 domain-containing protein [Cellulosimicrobium cellulans]|uniref:DUF262 domain-containing protein n=1 Tax=Cellulosimicrobium cellulans TaxID=1710 RepID=UPI003C47127E